MLQRPIKIEEIKTIVVKVGTRLLTYKTGKLNLGIIEKLVRELADFKNQGKEIILVSSGAVGAGIGKLGLKKKPVSTPEKQAAAAVGQGLLIQIYEKLFAEYGHVVAQVLLTREDIENRGRYINSRNTLLQLFRYGAIPIINENDTISTEEIEFGDNDRLSALVSTLVDADLLIILTDIDGLYTANPQLDPTAQFIPLVEEISPALKSAAGTTVEMMAKGGMITKLQAAEIAMSAGINMVIADGYQENILKRILSGEVAGTFFCAPEGHLNSRKRWIAFAQKVKGALTVDDGAEKALKIQGKSLLPIGITQVRGEFNCGEAVSIFSARGSEIARGLVNYSSQELSRIMGCRSVEIASILGYSGEEEVVHRDNLVLCGYTI